VRLDNNTDYAQLHSKYHPNIRRFLQEFGYCDIFIADISSGDIVYSVFKELDFATSIKTGPYTDTGIGEAFSLAANANSEAPVFLSELTIDLPSCGAMADLFPHQFITMAGRWLSLFFKYPLM
jgi:methyl-accepting chemotaxis protein